MRRFYREFRGRLWCLLAAVLLLIAFALKKSDRAAMNAAAAAVADPMRAAVSKLTYLVDFSMMELVLALALAAALAYVGVTAARLIRRKGERGKVLLSFFLTALCACAVISAAADWFWGVYYYADGLQEKSGIYAESVSLEELTLVTRYAAAQLSAASEGVPRDENGLFAASREEIFAEAAQVYDNISRELPCLAFEDRTPKPVYFSRVMSYLRLTGVYFAFTAEANLNVDSPACMLPATIAHELAHQRGIASEKECNFAAVLAATTADSPVYRYSGWLSAYVYLSNALYSADRELWQAIRDTLPAEVRADMDANNAYWAPFRKSPVSEGYQTLYDSYLKGYGQTEGVQSYGMVVELLTVYYRDRAAALAEG
ncbi:MAG: DUF3810 domain-containing protein [Oscillospiraceae bacterium]